MEAKSYESHERQKAEERAATWEATSSRVPAPIDDKLTEYIHNVSLHPEWSPSPSPGGKTFIAIVALIRAWKGGCVEHGTEKDIKGWIVSRI
jgi:hypothetical protein